MSDNNPRNYRVADQIQKDLAGLIRTEIKDPRLSQFVTIEEVRVTRDLSVAKVFITALDDKGEISQEVLSSAAGFLRRKLGQLIRMRSVPELRFVHDTVSEDGNRISGLIAEAVASDKANHASEVEESDDD